MNLKKVMMDLGNELVARGFDPSGPMPEALRHELQADHTTQPITAFSEWLNMHPEAVEVLESMGISWPTASRLGDSNGGSRRVQLSDLLADEAIAQLAPIMDQISRGELEAIEGKQRILSVLDEHREELLAKGVMPEYLAYVLLYQATK